MTNRILQYFEGIWIIPALEELSLAKKTIYISLSSIGRLAMPTDLEAE